jgi:transcriptional regulator with XRE-family HTH domain
MIKYARGDDMGRNSSQRGPVKRDGSLIEQARLKAGFTQNQLADAIGVGQTQIANWESGFRKPKMDALMRIGAALGVDWTTLIEQPQK